MNILKMGLIIFLMINIAGCFIGEKSPIKENKPSSMIDLMQAIKDNVITLDFLVQNQTNINDCCIKNTPSPLGNFTPLMYAVMYGSANTVKLICDAGGDPNISNGIVNPLCLAAAFRDVNMIKLLLKNGANLNSSEPLKYTPMEFALSNNKHAIIKYMIKEGVIVPENAIAIFASGVNKERAVALFLKESHKVKNNIEIIELLLKNNAKVDAVYGKINALALFCAVGEANAVKLLINKGADVNANYFYLEKNSRKKQRVIHPLNHSCLLPGHLGNIECAKLLIEHGADINFKSNFYSNKGVTPFMLAAENSIFVTKEDRPNAFQMLTLLLRHGANINALDSKKKTVLDLLYNSPYKKNADSYFEVIAFLKKHGAKTTEKAGAEPELKK